jgi:T5SS/PEP-CTERM-associated repeat protein
MKKTSTSLTTQTLVKNAILLAITAFTLSAAPGSRGDAALCGCTRSWDNLGTSDWFNPSNWAPYHDYIPGCGEEPVCPIDGGTTEANINNGGEAQITSTTTTAHACEVFLGRSNSTDSGTLTVDHGTLNQCNDMFVGYYGKGTLNIKNAGSVSTFAGASIGTESGSNGTATVDGLNSQWTVDGQLNVGGNNTTAGGTGLLTVKNNGIVTAESVHTYVSGTLTGNGTVTVNSPSTPVVTIDGTLTPSNGMLTVNGNLTFTSSATMECHVVPASADSANVSGAASLAGKISVTLTGTTFTAGTTYTLLHSGGARSNVFQFVSIKGGSGNCFTPIITYDSHNVYLYLSPCSN